MSFAWTGFRDRHINKWSATKNGHSVLGVLIEELPGIVVTHQPRPTRFAYSLTFAFTSGAVLSLKGACLTLAEAQAKVEKLHPILTTMDPALVVLEGTLIS